MNWFLIETILLGWGHCSIDRVPASKHKALSSSPSTIKKPKKILMKYLLKNVNEKQNLILYVEQEKLGNKLKCKIFN
jgi:hypothetical protein